MLSWQELFYPPFCLGCETGGFWVCEACLEEFELFTSPRLVDEPLFTSLVSLGPYVQPLWRLLMTKYKYQSATCLVPILQYLLERASEDFYPCLPELWKDVQALVAVPTDAKHVLERGFDHTQLLAQAVQEHILPVRPILAPLVRTRETEANASLEHTSSRALNMKGVFTSVMSVPPVVLLVDDVFTTGATCREAAFALREAGAQEIHVFTFAKG